MSVLKVIVVFIVVSLIAILGHILTDQKRLVPDRQAKSSSLPFVYRLSDGRGMEVAGIAVFDYDKDGDLDLYLTNGRGHPNALLENDGKGNFTNIAKKAGVDHMGGRGTAAADLDNDGYDDIFFGWEGKDVLYWNNGDGTFSKREFGQSSKTTDVILCDLDNDGWLDIYVGREEQVEGSEELENALYLNSGDRGFREVAEEIGISQAATRPIIDVFPHNPWAVACFDYDNDSDQDILVAVDFAAITLYKNELNETGKLTFSNKTLEAGLGATGNWMGLAIADYNNDGHKDIFATNWGVTDKEPWADNLLHALYRNNRDGTFTDVAEEAGLARWEFGWGAVPLDWDNDSDIDIYYAGNFFSKVDRRDNSGHIFLNEGDLSFVEASEKYALRNSVMNLNGEARDVASGDFNGDGFPDIVVTNVAFLGGESAEDIPGLPILFINPGLGK